MRTIFGRERYLPRSGRCQVLDSIRPNNPVGICLMPYDIDPNRSFEQNIFFEVKRRANEQGVTDLNEYLDLVTEVIAEKLDDGILTKHDDLAQLRSDLEHRFGEIGEEADEY